MMNTLHTRESLNSDSTVLPQGLCQLHTNQINGTDVTLITIWNVELVMALQWNNGAISIAM